MTDNETERVAALQRYDVLDTPPEESFDRITRLAKTVLKVPIVLVSLVDSDRQWFKSRQGLEADQTPRDISFCTHAIQNDEPLIVTNALEDPRFCDNPLVQGEPNIRFYIGVPLRTPDGHNIGTLCAIDREPRTLLEEQVTVLCDLARLVVDELELRQIATTDSLTGALTRRSFELSAGREVARANRSRSDLSAILLDLDHFKSINDSHGHATGDRVIQTVVGILQDTLRTMDLIARIGGEEFVALLPETAIDGARDTAERLRVKLSGTTISTPGGQISATASFGVAAYKIGELDIKPTLERADAALYRAKELGRDQVALDDDSSLSDVA